jgi:hypothetical protein
MSGQLVIVRTSVPEIGLNKDATMIFIRSLVTSCMTVFCVAAQTTAQLSPDSTARLLARLHSAVVLERIQAGSVLMASTNVTPSVLNGLIQLLETENAVIAGSFKRGIGVSREYGEGYSEYYSRLISFVARNGNLHDPRTLRAVANGAYNPESRIAQMIADTGGKDVLPITSDMLKANYLPSRIQALGVIGRVYENRAAHRLSEATADSLKQMVVNAVDDNVLRPQALSMLGKIGTLADIAFLQRVALSDTLTRVHDRVGKVYPNRDLANSAIAEIRRRNPR